METGKEIISRFPIEEIFLIITFGFFLVIFLPFDIFKVFTNGLSEIQFGSLQKLGSYVNDNFKPFINAQYLGNNFPNGFIEIFLLSLVFGLIPIFLHNQFNFINHIPKIVYRTVRKKSVQDKRAQYQEQMDFEDWIRKRGYQKYLDFIESMQAVATGLLWGAETLSAVVFVSFLASFLASDPDGDLWKWMIFSLMLWLIFFIVYKAYSRESDGVKGRLSKKFQESKPLVELIKFKRLLSLGVITREEYEREIGRRKKLILEKSQEKKGN